MKKAWIPDNAKAFTGMTGKALCCVALCVNVLYATMGVAKYGSQHIDAYGIWMLKARAIQIEQGVPLAFLRDPHYSYSHQQYPLLLPWLMSLSDSFLWAYPVGYMLVLVMMYVLTQSLFWTTVASFMGPLIAQGGRGHAGLADIWICLAVAVSLWAFRRRKLWLITMMIMIASQIKTEGIFLIAFFVPLLWNNSLSRQAWDLPYKGRVIGMILLSLVPFVWWQYQVKKWGIPSDFGLRLYPFVEQLTRLGTLIGVVGKEMLNWRNWYVVWGMVWINSLGMLPISLKKGDSHGKILGLMVVGYVFIYLFSTMPIESYAGSSVDRIMLQLLPLWWPRFTMRLCRSN